MELTTLCYIEQDGKYLMMLRNKKKNDINEGKYIGLGGHFIPGETPDECVLREVWEESGLTLTSYRMRGIITFSYKDTLEYMFLYTADAFTGEITDCDEGELLWVEKERIFDLSLWEGDRIFLRKLIRGDDFFNLKLVYGEDGELL